MGYVLALNIQKNVYRFARCVSLDMSALHIALSEEDQSPLDPRPRRIAGGSKETAAEVGQ